MSEIHVDERSVRAGLVVGKQLKRNFKDYIKTIQDFPIKGIAFKDITGLLAIPGMLATVGKKLAAPLGLLHLDAVAAIESRGFIIGASLATNLRSGLILIRKSGKLPGKVDSFKYTCEYCDGTLEVKTSSVQAGKRYVVCDDVLATGGTARATADYIETKGGVVAAFSFLLEISQLEGRKLLRSAPVYSLLSF